jgi:putative SOS response-associated peptidase YedK
MCGRFVLYSSLERIEKYFQASGEQALLHAPSYNITPAHAVLAMIDRGGDRRLGRLRWGLVPSRARDTSGAAKLINARAETLHAKPSFRNLLKNRRCAVIADGFYEWTRSASGRQAWYLSLPTGEPFAFAGLWDAWKGTASPPYYTCTIITTQASRQVSGIHQRMPVVLRADALEVWLDSGMQNTGHLQRILREGRVEEFLFRPVSPRVNNPAHNDERCLEPAQDGRSLDCSPGP